MNQAPDIQVRHEALNIRRSFILEAPAGSGKTALLTARFLALLADVGHPRQILAVTFTRKAAAEMAERITRIMRQAQDKNCTASPGTWENHLLELAHNALKVHPDWDVLLQSPDAFLVDTFHGFCGRVARNWPLESKTPPAFGLLDEIGQEALLDAAVAEYVHSFSVISPTSARPGNTYPTPAEIAAFRRRLMAANNSIRVISHQLTDILARRDRLGGLISIFQHPLASEELVRHTEKMAEYYLGRLHDYFVQNQESWHALQQKIAKHKSDVVGSFPAKIPGLALCDLSAWQSAANLFLTKSGTPRKQFKCTEFGPEFAKSPLADFIRELPPEIAWILNFTRDWPEAADPNGFEALTDCLTLAQGVLEHFGKIMNTRGLDFIELELAALRAFDQADRPGDSLIFFHEHLRHILVDEAQDMNDNQVRLLSTLTEGWEQNDGRTVFIVGDPKQSIFRFRRAEISLFKMLQNMGLPRSAEAPLPLSALYLSANFRSRPCLVAFANAAFARIMQLPREAFDEVAFNPSAPARDRAITPRPITLAMFSCRQGNSQQANLPLKSEARELEAQYVAGRVAALQREDRTASVAILIPARTHLTPYVRAMESLAIPIRLMEGVPMLDCPEVRHMLNLFKALLRPHDDIAWAGVLRAPWCNVPAIDLEKLAVTSASERWSEKIAGTGRQTHPEVSRFNAALSMIASDFGRESYAISLQRLWEELGGPAAVAQRFGQAGLANSMHCLDLLSQCPEGRGEETLATMERLLERAYTPPDPHAAFSPIAIMTIHKAKGLEFDHVFVVGLDRGPGGHARQQERDAAFMMERLPQDQSNERKFVAAIGADRRTKARSLTQLLLRDLGLQRDAAEYKRLIYVAATRARETITFSGLMTPTDDSAEQASAIAWLDAMSKENVFAGLPVEHLVNPTPDDTALSNITHPKRAPEPAPFDPNKLPYLIQSPSKIDDETATVTRSGADETDPNAKARGIVMHRLFETLVRNEPVPREAAVAVALVMAGLASDQAREMANKTLAECLRAWEFKEFAALRARAFKLIPEWGIEEHLDGNAIRVGRIDLFLETINGIVLVDFKTGRPSADHTDWLKSEIARYRPQLNAYRAMTAKTLNVPQEHIRPVLFFTALPRWIDIR